jgi:hopene-associated glycosyltransferase HpnB
LTASLAIAAVSFMVWIYLITGRGSFWRASVIDDSATLPEPRSWPAVVAVVPARNEQELIATSLGSLFALDYPGPFHIVLVDDQSTDGTAAAARAAVGSRLDRGLTVLSGEPLPRGWAGKVWTMNQGAEHAQKGAEPPRYLLLSDADISFACDALKRLVARAERDELVLTSLMAKLRCVSPAERCLIPAFVFFFQMLYPFQWVNRPDFDTAAAAGGCMLVRVSALTEAGGFAAIRDRLIDDCALAKLLKPFGPIWLGLTERVHSLRPYPQIDDVGRMISRSAYEQLGRSPFVLAATLAGMALTYLVPPGVALSTSGFAQVAGAAAWLLMAAAFQPMARFYRVNPAWGLLLPVIAGAYMVFTLRSAYQHACGKGGQWKGRVRANVSELE